MPKGFMIFVEGKEPPSVVHRNHKSAWHEMHRLAEENKDLEILLLNVSRRFIHKSGEERATSIGSHLPEDERLKVSFKELVKKDNL